MSDSKARENQEARLKRNYSERLGEERGDRYLRDKGYQNQLNDKQKGIKQGHDAIYSDPRTRSAELDRSAQIVRNRDKYSKLQVKEAQRNIKHHYQKNNGYIPNNKSETVVAEFKGGGSKESGLQKQPDWAIRVAENIRDRRDVYKNASKEERKAAEEVLKAHKESRLRYEVITTKNDKAETKQTRVIKPAEHDDLYAAKSQKGLDNIDALKSNREKLKEAIERGDIKEEKELRERIRKNLPEQRLRLAKRRLDTNRTQERLLKRKLENANKEVKSATKPNDRSKAQEKESTIRRQLQEHYKRRIQGASQREDKKEFKKLNRRLKKLQPPEKTITKKRGR